MHSSNIFPLKYYIFNIALYFVSFFLIYVLEPNGVDWPGYRDITIDFSKQYFYREPLGWFLIYIFRDFGSIFFSSFLLSMLSTSSFRLSFLLSSDYVLSFLLALLLSGSSLYLLLSVNGLRQGIALVFLIFFFYFFVKQNRNYMILSFICAVLCHNSAALFFMFVFFYYNRSSFFVSIIIFLFLMSSYFIVGFAGKNSNLTVTDNTFIFSVASLIVLFFTFLGPNERRLGGFRIIVFSIFIISFAFIWSSSIFNRLVYYSLPLGIIFSSLRIVNYKPAYYRYSFLLLFVFIVWLFSLQHSSVRANFLY